jgi:hypothetical protein
MTAHLILTVDYEIFGNGQGCLQHCVVEPTRRLMEAAEKFDAPITLFAEAAELMTMERVLGRNVVQGARDQLRRAVRDGHDVQLHLHPQWLGARRRNDEGWELDFSRWRIGDLPEHEVDDLIAAGKGWIDDAAFANVPGGGCSAFRAGNWCIQPSESVIRSLRRHGFAVESTVVPGVRRSAPGQWSDFRSVPTLPFWRVDRDVCVAAPDGLWEVPITAGRVAWFEQLSAELQARTSEGSRFAPNCQGSYRKSSSNPLQAVQGNIQKLLDLGLAKLDLSTMPVATLAAVTRDWMRRFDAGNGPIPIVAIAHTKNWTDRSTGHLLRYLAWARDTGLQFSTYSRWLQALSSDCLVGAGVASVVPSFASGSHRGAV